MKVALLTHYLPTQYEDYTELFKLTGPLRDEYCARHGYQHIVHSGRYGDLEYYAYQRLELLRDLMDKPDAADLYWVLNVQAILTNLVKPITDFVDDQHDFWISRDCHDINAGSFVIRNSPGGKEWLDFIISLEPQYRGDCWKEQRAIIHNVDNPRFKDRISIVPQESFNSYDYALYDWPPTTPGDWRPGHLVLSLPGLNLRQRLDLVRSDKWQNAIIR